MILIYIQMISNGKCVSVVIQSCVALPDSLKVLSWGLWSESLPPPLIGCSSQTLFLSCWALIWFWEQQAVVVVLVVVQCCCWIHSNVFVTGVDGQRAAYRLVTWSKLVPRGFFLCHMSVDSETPVAAYRSADFFIDWWCHWTAPGFCCACDNWLALCLLA